MKTQTHRTQIRMADDLYDAITAAAEANNRSINAEMTDRLRLSFQNDFIVSAAFRAEVLSALDALRQDIADLPHKIK